MAAPRTDISIVLGLISASSTFLFPIAAVLAQITPDATLGSESSIVTPDTVVNGAQADLIEGGALRGANVFHSFQDFNVNDGQRVYFANPTGIENILSRVTGGNVSNIFGTLGVDGAANLFLLNPSGVVFGPNAQLDVSGAFTVTTAERYSFLDGTDFSATNPDQAPLVTVSITPGVQFNGAPQGDITNQGNLAVGAEQTLAFHGDTVTNSGDLTAEGGTVIVLGNQVVLTDQATVDVSSTTGGGDVFIGGDYKGQGDLPTAQQAVVAAGVRINADALETGDGGTVIVWADDTTQFAGSISARGGALSGDGGFVETSGAQTLSVAPTATVTTTAFNGQWGTWLLDPADLEVVGSGTANIVGGTNSPVAATGIPAATIVTALNTTAVTLLATNSITVNEAINASGNANANNLTLDAPTLTLNQDISTNGGQIYDGNVVLGADVALTGDTVTFNNTINGGQALTIALTNLGTATFNGVVGGTPLTSLNITGTGATTNINAAVTATALSLATTTTNFNGGAVTGNITGDATIGNTYAFNGGTVTGNLNGNGGTNTVQGANVANTFTVTGANSGTATGISGTFSNIQNLTGGPADDSFTLSGGTLAGVVDGGAGTDTLTGDNVVNTFTVTGANSGTANNVTGGFSNVENLTGGTNTDSFTLSGGTLSGAVNGGTGTNTLTGNTGANTFTVTGANSGTATGVGSFSNIQALVGNTGTDTFTLSGGSIATLSGAGGVDTFNLNSGSATTVNGDGGNDQFNLGAVTVTTVDGGANTDTVTGTAGNDIFQITGGTGASVGGTTLQNIDTLEGADGNDTFDFNDGVTFAGTIRGGDTVTDTGDDTLDYTAFTADPNVNLAALGATGIESILGSTQFGVTSTLTGANTPNTWAVNGADSGTINVTTSFSNFTNLVGGTNTDTFTIAAGGDVTSISGGNGVDTINLNGGSVTTLNGGAGADQFNLNSGSATTVNGDGGNDQFNLGAATVTTVDGGANTDTVTGTAGNDIFQITGGTGASVGGTTLQNIDTLEGADGDDTFDFNDGVTFAGTIRGGDTVTDTGDDTLNYTAFTADPNVNLAALGATGIESILGSTQFGVTSTLTGANTPNVWAVNNPDEGTINVTTSFSNFTNLVGGTNTDAFTIAAGGDVTSISGGDGIDTVNLDGGSVTTLNGGAGADQFNLNSGTATNVNGDGGADSFNLGATAIAAIDGGAGTDTINGTAGNDRFQVSGSETGTVTQTNGSPTTTTFQEIEGLNGGLGDDTFAFNDAVDTTAIAIDGGGDTDTLDFSAYTVDPNVDLSVVGTSIETVTGTTNPAVTTLIGFTAANTWDITGPNSGTATDGVTTLSFSNFNTLTGNGNGDTFNLNGGTVATLNGAGGGDSFNLNSGTVTTVNGDAGQDTFTLNGATVTTIVGGEGAIDNDTLQGTIGNDSATLTGNEAGTVNGIVGFSEIETFAGNGGDTTLVGTAGDDTLTLQALGTGVVLQGVAFDAIASFDGSAGNDTIVGSTGDDGFQIAGSNTGQITQVNGVAAALGFQNVENLNGANGNDTFAFNNGISSTAVNIDGGGGALDTLDFSAYTSNFSVDLSAVGTRIEEVNGSVTVTAATLLGFNGPTTWTVNGLNSGTVASGATTLTFNDFNILTGNTAVDTFNLNGGGSVTALNGGDGNDLFNFNGGNGISANGGLGDDTFTLNGVAVATSLIGGSGDDQFQLNNGATSTGLLSGGADTDTLDYGGYNADVAVNLAAGTATGISGASSVEAYIGDAGQTNTFTGTNAANTWSLTDVNTGNIGGVGGISFQNFQNLVGGTGNDTITWRNDAGNNGSIVGGTINGGSGVLVLQSDDLIAFTGATGVADITGTEGLVLQPVTAGTAIRFGGAGVGLNVNPALLNEISASFTDITIGNGDTGAVTLGNIPLTFQSPTTIQGAAVTAGAGGNITANGQDISLNAFGAGGIDVQNIDTSATANGGNVRLTADTGDIAVGAIDTSSTNNLGGSVAITAAQGGVTLNGDITTSGDQGGGRIEVTALNDVTATGITIGAETQGSGVAAQITSLQAQVAQFTAIRGIFEFFCSAFGFSCGTVNFYTTLINSLQSQITALQNGSLIPGSIDIGSTAGNLTLTGATLRTSSQGIGDIDGGAIALRAGQNLTLDGTNISSSTESTLGDGGAVTLQAGGALDILANAVVETSTTGVATGRGGNITASSGGLTTIADSVISASSLSTVPTVAGDITLTLGGLTLDNGEIIAETSNNSPTTGFVTVSGTPGVNVAGGNIRLTGAGTSVLQMSNDSLISARAIQTGAAAPGELFNSNGLVPGGNIFISGFGTVQAAGAGAAGNDIVTNASVGLVGGVIDISPSVLVDFDINTNGDDYSVLRTNGLNDIASNGTVAVFNLTIGNESSDNTIAFINAADLVGNSCAPASATSSFTVGGRGGIPVNPLAPLSPLVGEDSWIFLEDVAPTESFYNAETTVAANLPAELGECYFQWQAAL